MTQRRRDIQKGRIPDSAGVVHSKRRSHSHKPGCTVCRTAPHTAQDLGTAVRTAKLPGGGLLKFRAPLNKGPAQRRG
jgi:hypothetical protein